MFSSVTVTGPPAAIWRRKIGTTDPDEPRTLPKRTVAKRVCSKRCCAASTAHSASVFEAPITVAGLTALSVETSTKRFTPVSPAAAAAIRVATALLRTASTGFSSISGTCLYAAAWKTTAGRCSPKISRMGVALPARGHGAGAKLAWCRRDRDDHLGRLGAVEDARQLVGRALDLEAGDADALLARVVVDEPDRHAAELGVAPQLRGHQLAAVAGSDDQHLARVLARERPAEAAF